ncbi:hypothetical protein N9W62_01910 [Akkermansiaceae bacterium]|nr:hypothetical protein [Akkermansiaceae bacterium]
MAAVKVPTGYSGRRTKNFHQAQDSGPGLFYFSSYKNDKKNSPLATKSMSL